MIGAVGDQERLWISDVFAMIWSVWIGRIACIFRDYYSTNSCIWPEVAYIAFLWCKAVGLFRVLPLGDLQRECQILCSSYMCFWGLVLLFLIISFPFLMKFTFNIKMIYTSIFKLLSLFKWAVLFILIKFMLLKLGSLFPILKSNGSNLWIGSMCDFHARIWFSGLRLLICSILGIYAGPTICWLTISAILVFLRSCLFPCNLSFFID